MSDFEDYDDDFDQAGYGPLSSKPYTVFDPDELEDERSSLRLPGPGPPPLRSRGPIDFSGQHLAVGAPSFSGSRRPSSHMSGSTLHSSLNPSTAYLYSRKTYLPIDPSPIFLPEAIASLTEVQLHHNPHYHKLLQKYDHVCEILIGRDLAESRAAQSNISVPDIYQGM
jgi:hypothetical protein